MIRLTLLLVLALMACQPTTAPEPPPYTAAPVTCTITALNDSTAVSSCTP